MRKIKAKHDNNDRIICVTITDKHRFYYQPAGSFERFWLFDTKEYSSSIFVYFRNRGRNMEGRGFSLTIKELYDFKNYQNPKLAAIIRQIPLQVDYILRESA